MTPPPGQPRIDPSVKPAGGEQTIIPPARPEKPGAKTDLMRDLLPQFDVGSDLAADGSKWKFTEQDYEAALKTAMETGKPVVLKIGTKGCSDCDIMDRQAIPQNEELLKANAVFVKVDGLKARELCTQLGAEAWPVNFVGHVQPGADGKPEFKPVARKDFMKPEEYSAFLRSALPIARSNIKKPYQPPKPQPQQQPPKDQPFIRR